jgi:hypothetical protein
MRFPRDLAIMETLFVAGTDTMPRNVATSFNSRGDIRLRCSSEFKKLATG